MELNHPKLRFLKVNFQNNMRLVNGLTNKTLKTVHNNTIQKIKILNSQLMHYNGLSNVKIKSPPLVGLICAC